MMIAANNTIRSLESISSSLPVRGADVPLNVGDRDRRPAATARSGNGAWLPVMCLHHIEGGEVELAYARGDCWAKRKAALMAWEAFLGKPAPKLKPVA
jgi:hypothetical protein